MPSDSKFLKPLKILVIAILFLPAVFWSLKLFPLDYNFSRVLIFFLLIEISFIFYLFLVLKDKRYLPPLNLIFLFLFLFLISNFISLLNSIDFQKSLFGTLTRSADSSFIAYLHYFLFFVVLSGLLKDKKIRKTLIFSSVIAAFFVCLIGFGQVVISRETLVNRIEGSLGNPLLYSFYLGLNIFLAGYLFLREKEKNHKIFYSLFILMAFLSIIFSGSRTAFLFLILISFVLTLYFFRKNRKFRLSLGISLICFLGILLILLLLGKLPPVVWRLFDISFKRGGLGGRIAAWKILWPAVLERPFFGWGQEGTKIAFDKHYEPSFLVFETFWDRAHNLYLDTALVSGFIGLAFYLLAFVLAFKFFSSSPFLLASLVFYLLYGLTLFDSFPVYLMIYFILGLACSFKSDLDFAGGRIENRLRVPILSLLILVFPLPLLSIFVFPRFALADFYLNNRVKLYYPKDFKSVKKAYALNTPYQGEISYFLADNFIQNLRYGYIPDEKIENDYQFVEQALEETSEKHPKNSLLYYQTAHLNVFCFSRIPKKPILEKAEKNIKKALELSPKKLEYLLELAFIKEKQGNVEEAEKVLDKIIKLNPEYPDVYYVYGLLRNKRDKKDSFHYFKMAYILGFVSKVKDSKTLLKFASIFYKQKQYQPMIPIYKKLTRLYPKNEKYYKNLIWLYNRTGQKKKAEEIILKLINLK